MPPKLVRLRDGAIFWGLAALVLACVLFAAPKAPPEQPAAHHCSRPDCSWNDESPEVRARADAFQRELERLGMAEPAEADR